MKRLEGKTAVVTGAGSGIGRGIARMLAEEGATLVLSGRTRATLDATADEVRSLGATAHVVPADVTDEAAVVALFAEVRRIAATLDLLVNNAGAFDGGPIEELSLETWNRVVAVNLTGPFLCNREALRIMRSQRSGRIINVGSISAQVPRSHAAPYAASKHGLVGLTKATALDAREYGVSVCCVHPGNVMTERRAASDAPADAEPMMTPAELAEAVRTMATLPPHVNLLEAIILPVGQAYLGRG